MAKYIETDAIIEDLRYDIELDARTLDDLDFIDSKERELVQLDKDIKQNVISILEQTPTADVRENVHARFVSKIVKKADWKGQMQSYYQPHTCSNCNAVLAGEENFCPNCGAVMDERSEDGEIHNC